MKFEQLKEEKPIWKMTIKIVIKNCMITLKKNISIKKVCTYIEKTSPTFLDFFHHLKTFFRLKAPIRLHL